MSMGSLLVVVAVMVVMVVGTAESRPSLDHDPLKFSLDKQDHELDTTSPPLRDQLNSRIQNGMEWLGRMADAIRLGRGRLVNSVAIARNIIAERVEELRSETRNNVAGAIGAASDIIERGRGSYEQGRKQQVSKGRETAKLESESEQGLLERKNTNPLSSLIESIVKPTPIVDGLDEKDKYGNNGDRFIGVGRALVSGFEGIGNILNAIAEFPVKAAKQTSRNLTEALNQIGARIVGLQ